MFALTPASEVILRHSDELASASILFAGDLHDTLPAHFSAQEIRVHTQQYHYWQMLHPSLNDRVQFSWLPEAELLRTCNTLIYYWPKSKQEAQFQLLSLLAQLPLNTDIFIIGENRSGVRSAESILKEICPLLKIDSARRCSLYYGKLTQSPLFQPAEWWRTYQYEDITVKTLPGVFSQDQLDEGSKLLLSTIGEVQGKVLDVGCGAGVLAAALAKRSNTIQQLTLSDVSAAALEASKITLAVNNIAGSVLPSNVFSNITGKFDHIISNPPFHEGRKTSLQAAELLIRGSANHLNVGGKLTIVANAFLPYPDLLEATFGHSTVLAKTGRFKVYQGTLHPSTRNNNNRKK